MDYSPPASSVHGVLQARIQEGLPCPPPGDLPNPGVELRSFALQADSLPTVLSGKSKIVTKKDEAIKEVTMIFKIARSNYSVQTAVLGKKTVKKKKKNMKK